MADIIVRCPDCGNEIQTDENTESLFCGECGKKILLREAAQVPVPAEASVPVPAAGGFMAQADKLFSDRRYKEAYEGYTRYLQAHPGDIHALYRQGISAVYLSEGTIFRIAELRSAVGAAVNAMNKAGDYTLAPEKDTDLIDMLVYMTAHGVTFSEKLAGVEQCTSQANGWVALTGLYQEASALITSDERREEALKAGVDFCDRALGFKVSYSTGTKQTSKGKTVEEYEDYALDKKQRSVLKEARRRMAVSYNSLGTRTTEEARLNEDAETTEKNINRLKGDIHRTKDKYNASRVLFLADNPAVKEGARRILRNSMIISGIVVLVLAVIEYFMLKKDKAFLFILILLLLGAFLYISHRVSSKNLKEYEASQYPEELRALYDRLEEDYKQLKENKKHASETKDAIKKFNKSKL